MSNVPVLQVQAGAREHVLANAPHDDALGRAHANDLHDDILHVGGAQAHALHDAPHGAQARVPPDDADNALPHADAQAHAASRAPHGALPHDDAVHARARGDALKSARANDPNDALVHALNDVHAPVRTRAHAAARAPRGGVLDGAPHGAPNDPNGVPHGAPNAPDGAPNALDCAPGGAHALVFRHDVL